MLITLPPLKRFVRRGKRLSPLRHCGINAFLRFKQPIGKLMPSRCGSWGARKALRSFLTYAAWFGKRSLLLCRNRLQRFFLRIGPQFATAWQPVGLRGQVEG